MVGWDPVLSVDRPDRMDALVWALSELSESSRGILGLHQYWLNMRQNRQRAGLDA